MDELQRYVDVLFADYRDNEAANAFRLSMLNDLLLEKERLQMSGKTEREAITAVLASLDDFGAPAEGNRLIYMDRFHCDNALNLVVWLFVCVLLSVPVIVLFSPVPSLVLLAALLAAAVNYFRLLNTAQFNAVEFIDVEQTPKRKLIIGWAVFALIWMVAMSVLKSFMDDVSGKDIVSRAMLLSRYYVPFTLAPLLFWVFSRKTYLLMNEVGAEESEALPIDEQPADAH